VSLILITISLARDIHFCSLTSLLCYNSNSKMAGASKRRAQKERQDGQSSKASSKASSDNGSATHQASGGFAGPADPAPTRGPVNQSHPSGLTGRGDAGRSITPYINRRLELPHAAYGLFDTVSIQFQLLQHSSCHFFPNSAGCLESSLTV
jgi:hypothetical protein